MTQVLLVSEDLYCRPLERLVASAVCNLCGVDASWRKCLAAFPAKGNGNFENLLGRNWGYFSKLGFTHPESQKARGPAKVIICVADADRATQVCPTVPAIPDKVANRHTWIDAANQSWTKSLREYVNTNIERGAYRNNPQLFGRFIRWNKESLVLAAYDHEVALVHLDLDVTKSEKARAYLSKCNPDPRNVIDGHVFADTFDSPEKCLKRLLEDSSDSTWKKNAPALDDLLKAVASARHVGKYVERLPDIKSLAELIASIVNAAASTSHSTSKP